MQFRPLQIETKIIKCYTNIFIKFEFVSHSILLKIVFKF